MSLIQNIIESLDLLGEIDTVGVHHEMSRVHKVMKAHGYNIAKSDLGHPMIAHNEYGTSINYVHPKHAQHNTANPNSSKFVHIELGRTNSHNYGDKASPKYSDTSQHSLKATIHHGVVDPSYKHRVLKRDELELSQGRVPYTGGSDQTHNMGTFKKLIARHAAS